MIASDLLVAWAAGFFDGEGCVMVQRRKGRSGSRGGCYVMQISASQKHPEPLYRLLEVFRCGAVHQTKRRESYGCDMWVWKASGNFANEVLKRMLPYLVVKREQAEVAIVFQDRRIRVRADKFDKAIVARQVVSDESDRVLLKALKRQPPVILETVQ